MEEFKNLPTEQLLELISQYTGDYTRMIREGATDDEYIKCERFLILLQEEIRFRSPNISNTDINFISDISE